MRRDWIFLLLLATVTSYVQASQQTTSEEKLFAAIEAGELEKVETLVREGVNIESKDENGTSAVLSLKTRCGACSRRRGSRCRKKLGKRTFSLATLWRPVIQDFSKR